MNIDKILNIAIKNNASDVHLVHGLYPVLRIDGRLFSLKGASLEEAKFSKEDHPEISEESSENDDKFFLEEPVLSKKIDDEIDFDDGKGFKMVTSEDLHKSLKKALEIEQLERFYNEKDYDFSYEFNGFRFRANLSYERNHFKAVFRIINKQSPTLMDIDMGEGIKKLLNLNHGLILVTGPSGCGKSTSLAAMINYINDNRNCNIVTLEDPIEFIFKSNKSVITQRQLGTDMVSFASGLKHVLRQDPNVIMVGEMRDLDTISTAITLAETGHLILATLHTCNAAQTIDRIIDIFPSHQQGQIKSQLSLILSAVISQVLLPKVGGGRVAAREILINNSAVSNLIRDQKIAQLRSVIETHSRQGMISFEKSIESLCDKGLIDMSEAKSFLDNKLFFS
jgi:twitching motility protein PilT